MRRLTRNVRWIALLLAWAFSTSPTLAVPAAPFPAELEQPDGTRFLARPWGDEWLHGMETLDGYTILKDGSGWWVYAARDASDRLVPSGQRVGLAAPANLEPHARPGGLSIQRAPRLRAEAAQRVVPSSGSARIPVILIDYPDLASVEAPADFEDLLFAQGSTVASGPGGLRDYYEEVSYGTFSLQGTVTEWVHADNNRAYYGGNDPSGDDLCPNCLVEEAVLAADPVVDFSQFDNDRDGYVDVVAVVHAGHGEEESPSYGDENDIWSHRWSMNGANYWLDRGPAAFVVDGVTVNDYIIMPEKVSGAMGTIGVFAHEFGHSLGLPDLYDTDGSSEGIGEWGLMGSGSWNQMTRPGDSPAHMMAWSKAVLGWLSPQEVTGPPQTYSIPSAHALPAALQLLPSLQSGGGSGEYFLLENRQQQGFDLGLPGSGLLIWHVDESRLSNADESHRLVDLEEADGLQDLDGVGNRGDDGDPFPGSSYNTEFHAASAPSSRRYDGSDPGFVVTSISASAPTMQAEVGFPGAPVSEIPLTHGPNPARSSATFSFELYGHQATLHVFDVAGRLVHRAPLASDQTEHVWSLTDTAGRPLANGLYLYVVILDDGTRSAVERLVIER